MSFRIEKTDGIIEVHVWGKAAQSEIVTILRKLHEMAPRKEISDLWLLSEEYVLPWDTFMPIVKEVRRLLAPGMIAKKSALVVSNHFQMAQAKLYLEEARVLPFEMAAFMTREEAVRWLKT